MDVPAQNKSQTIQLSGPSELSAAARIGGATISFTPETKPQLARFSQQTALRSRGSGTLPSGRMAGGVATFGGVRQPRADFLE